MIMAFGVGFFFCFGLGCIFYCSRLHRFRHSSTQSNTPPITHPPTSFLSIPKYAKNELIVTIPCGQFWRVVFSKRTMLSGTSYSIASSTVNLVWLNSSLYADVYPMCTYHRPSRHKRFPSPIIIVNNNNVQPTYARRLLSKPKTIVFWNPPIRLYSEIAIAV